MAEVPPLDELREYSEQLAGLPRPPEETLILMRSFLDAAKAAQRTFILDAVEEGSLTRRHAAELTDRHPLTISRWIAAREVEQAP